MKKYIALFLAVIMVFAMVACAPNNPTPGNSGEGTEGPERVTGKILYLCNVTDGPQYEAYAAYLDTILGKLGYSWELVIADPSNDPAGNLAAVQNAMTNNVVGLIASPDGGLAEIMAEYPDLYVAGFVSGMDGVFEEGGTSAACLESDHFLGTVGEQYINGEDLGKLYFDVVVEHGYKKVATITFPPFAYPHLMVADVAFRTLVAEYNETATEPIEIVGEVEVLMFEPLSDAYFMEASRQDLDAIVAPVDGCAFVYPAMRSAIDAGVINKDTKLLTSGFHNDEGLMADFGGDGIVQSIVIAGVESMIWPVVMLDNAIQGKLPADYTGPERLDSAIFLIDSREDLEKVISSSLLYSGDASKMVADWEVVKTFLTSYNENASYAALKEYLASEALTVEGLK